jgi:ABC-type uncharacterized transport system permease subunit
MGANCALSLSILSYIHEAKFIQKLIKANTLQKLKSLISLSGILMMLINISNPNLANLIPIIYPQRT